MPSSDSRSRCSFAPSPREYGKLGARESDCAAIVNWAAEVCPRNPFAPFDGFESSSRDLQLLGCDEQQIANLGQSVRHCTFLDQDELVGPPDGTVALATGPLPNPEEKRRWLLGEDCLPGLEAGRVSSPVAVWFEEVRLADAIIDSDENTTAEMSALPALADRARQVALTTPAPFVGKESTRTSADDRHACDWLDRASRC